MLARLSLFSALFAALVSFTPDFALASSDPQDVSIEVQTGENAFFSYSVNHGDTGIDVEVKMASGSLLPFYKVLVPNTVGNKPFCLGIEFSVKKEGDAFGVKSLSLIIGSPSRESEQGKIRYMMNATASGKNAAGRFDFKTESQEGMIEEERLIGVVLCPEVIFINEEGVETTDASSIVRVHFPYAPQEQIAE